MHHILGSRDRGILVRGAAGVGKTTLMQEAAGGIRACGQEMLVFAPTARAGRSLARRSHL